MKWIAALVVPLALAACESDTLAPEASLQIPAGAVQLETTELVSVQAQWSGFGEPVRSVITDEEGWIEAWDRIHAHLSNPPSAPLVDFGSSVVVLAAMGTRPTGGYSIRIEDVHRHAGRLFVSALERSPGTACTLIQVLTAPVHAVEISGAGGEAEFAMREETAAC